MTDPGADSVSEELSRALEEYLAAAESGSAPEPEEFISLHPHLAESLRPCLVALKALGVAPALDSPTEDIGVPLPGESLAGFRLVREIGRGGMGTVYLAAAERARGGLEPGDPVALKVVHAHLHSRGGFRRRLMREAEAGRGVRHENVVRTFLADSAESGGVTRHFLVMEHVEGRTLRELLRDLSPVPENLVREIARQLASGLSAIHAAGIVHRDLKPENVLLTEDHRVRIMDLGVARVVAESVALTEEGQFAGTLAYAAPEQFRGGEVGPALDLYSLGLLLYELTTGVNPFRGEDVAAVIHAHLEKTPRPADDLASGVSPFFSALLTELLEKDPASRPGSAEEVRQRLEEGEASRWWTERRKESARRRPGRPSIPVRRDTEVYGREAELGALREAWEDARAGRGGSVLVEGEAGIGKTRLVDSVVSGLAEEDVTVLYGSYSPSGGKGALSEAILDHVGRPGLEERLTAWLPDTPALAPAFAALLAHSSSPGGSAAPDAEALNALFVQVMKSLAGERPLLWVVEDLHFSTVESRRLVLSLARALAGHRVLLLQTTRPGLPEEEIANFTRLETHRRVPLGRLSPREVVRLLLDAFKSERLAEKLGVKIAYKSDGVPFFVFEMIRGLKEGQFITELPDGSWIESEVIDEIAVPPAVRDLVEARLGDLTDEDRSLLDVAAVNGYEFDPDLVARVRGRPRVRVLEGLAAIERRSGVVCGEGVLCRFDHHLIQEVLYENLLPALRAEYHSLVARAHEERLAAGGSVAGGLDGEDAHFAARHHLKGAAPADGLPYFSKALEHLERSFRGEEAVRLASRALGEPGLLSAPERVDLLLRTSRLLESLGRAEPWSEAVREAVELADSLRDDRRRARSRIHLADLFKASGRLAEAREAAREAIDLARSSGAREVEARAEVTLGLVHRAEGGFEEAKSRISAALSVYRELEDASGESRALLALGNVHGTVGEFAAAKDHAERALDLARAIGDRGREAAAAGDLGAACSNLGEFDAGRAHYERAVRLAREVGNRPREAAALGALGKLEVHLGRCGEAAAPLARQLELARETGRLAGELEARSGLGFLALQLGRFEECRSHSEAAHELAERSGARAVAARSRLMIGTADRMLGRLGAALRHVTTARAASRELGDGLLEADTLRALAWLLTDLGAFDEARALLERFLAEGFGDANPLIETEALYLLGAAAAGAGDAAAAIDRLSEVRKTFADRAVWENAGAALVRRAQVYAAEGRTAEALADLDESLDLGRRYGDRNLVLLSLARRCALLGDDPSPILDALREHEDGPVEPATAIEVGFTLWSSTGGIEHLAEARRRLRDLVEHAPAEYRESMVANVPLYRDVLAAYST